jgi:asparagine synthase (glutamine-hydrolysing)
VLRYLAFIWDNFNADSAATAVTLAQRLSESSSEWQRAVVVSGLTLFVRRSPFNHYTFHLLGESEGAVIGLLFDRRNPLRSSAERTPPFFDEIERRTILATEGRHLVQRYWGRYVAFLNYPLSRRVRVLRDPVGDLRCYRAGVHGVDVYFSALPDFLQLNSLRLSVNWQHLSARVLVGNAWADESALNEIETVHPGECFEHAAASVSRTYYWHPLADAISCPLESPNAAAGELRSITKECVHAWAALHTNVVHILSGGLDSSIALACLADAPRRPRVSCLNFRTRDPDSDERAYARLAAKLTGCALTEQERTASLTVDCILSCQPTVGPMSVIMRGLEVQPLIAQFAHAQHATALSSGDGGDLLFFHGWPQLAVIDYAHRRGLRPGLLSLARDCALPAQLSIWRLLYEAMLHGILRRKWDLRSVISSHYRLVTDAVAGTALNDLNFLNPWKQTLDGIPPGKILHAFSATRPCLFRDPLGTEPELDIINPLVSQPILEACLRIPTYIHAADGRDRAAARDAFEPDLPREIILRTWKGAADGHFQALLRHNLAFVRELLIDGALVKQGILDRRKIEECLSDRPTRRASHPTEVFGYVCTEAWLRHWQPNLQPITAS